MTWCDGHVSLGGGGIALPYRSFRGLQIFVVDGPYDMNELCCGHNCRDVGIRVFLCGCECGCACEWVVVSVGEWIVILYG